MRNLSRVVLILLGWVGFILAFPLKSALTENPLIVEVQIAGEKSSDDFIKIYNPTNSDIYLGNYQGSYLRLVKRTKTSTKDYTIKSWSRDPEAKIPAGGFYLWANKDYTTFSNVDTSTSQTIASNNGIALRLGSENTGLIIDALGWGDFNNLLFEGNPFPENPSPNQKLERKKIVGVYQDTNNNSQDFYLNPPSQPSLPETEVIPKEEPQPQPEPKPITYPSGIFINEILPSPMGSDEEEEWIELKNSNNEEVSLSGWKIQDKRGVVSTYTFPENTKISPQGFLVLSRPTTKITLNNESDGVSLIQPDSNVIDIVTYEKAPRGESYNRTDSGWLWSTTLTPGNPNQISAPQISPEEGEEKEKSEVVTKGPAESEGGGREGWSPGVKEKEMAAIGEQVSKKTSFFPLLIALVIAIFSGIIVLILKKRIKKEYVQ